MANLPESSTWDAGVYQIETSDPVLGGVSGPANAGAKNLANRTLWLKNRLAALAVTESWTEVVRTTTGTWTCPSGVTQVLVQEIVGGGGGGAGSSTSVNGGGGGEGCRIRSKWITVVPTTEYTLTIGAGGAPGDYYAGGYDASQLGDDGGDTSFGVLLVAPGGKGGGLAASSDQSIGGLGGTTTIGGAVYSGDHGESNAPESGSFGSPYIGRGGGVGGSWRRTVGGDGTTAFDGGGGQGGRGSGQAATAGAAGLIRFAYPTFTVTGNT